MTAFAFNDQAVKMLDVEHIVSWFTTCVKLTYVNVVLMDMLTRSHYNKGRYSMSDGRKMTSRIPVTPEVHQTLKDMAHGADITFDALLREFIKEKGVDVKSRESAIRWGLDNRGSIEVDNND